jgi:hypothetical protein
MILALGFTMLTAAGLERSAFISLRDMEIVNLNNLRLGEPGMLLSADNFTVVLLNDPKDPHGARVVSIPGKSLIYQEDPIGPENKPLERPPAPFRNESNFFMENISIDFSLASIQIASRFKENIISFLVYAGALILLLVSLRFIFQFSHWPLANLFLAALAFRGVLALDSFLNTGRIMDYLNALLQNRLPRPFITPSIFLILSVIIIIYSVLVSAAGHRRTDED